MKKGLLIFILTILFIFNVFGQKIICFTITDDKLCLKENYVEFITLEKYSILKDYCVKNYFPSLADATIKVGETVNNALDASNDNRNLGYYAAAFGNNGNYKIVFSGKHFLSMDEMIQLMCHELAHLSSGEFNHDSPGYKAEIQRLSEFGIDLVTRFNNSKCNVDKVCRK